MSTTIDTLRDRFVSNDGTHYDTVGVYREELENVIAEAAAANGNGRLRDHPEFAAYKRAADQTAANLRAALERHSMDPGQAEQRLAESRICRGALGFDPDSEHVSPADLRDKIIEAMDVVAEAYDVFVLEKPKDDDHEARVEDRMIRLFGGDYPRQQKA